MLKSHLNKKQIGDKHYFEPQLKKIDLKRIVRTNRYTTNGESLILVKDIDECRIILDDTTTEHIIIKTLTKVYITPSRNKIDEYKSSEDSANFLVWVVLASFDLFRYFSSILRRASTISG